MTSTVTDEVAGPVAPRRAVETSLSATAIAVVVAFIVAATAVAVLAFTRDDGSATPEDATRSMFAAIETNDVLGVLEQLPPGERKSLRDELPAIGGELTRLGLLSGFDIRDAGDVQIRFQDVALRSSRLADSMAAVEVVGGSVDVTLPAGPSPLTDRARELLQRDFDVSLDGAARTVHHDFGTEPLRIIAVREGGGWHVSIAYSVADALRVRAGLSLPELGEGKGPEAIGSNTPDQAVSDLLDAYADGDPQRTVTVLYPDDARALYDYAPVFIPTARAEAERVAADGTFDVQRNRIETAVEGTDSTRTVRVTALDLDIRDELKKIHVTYENGCFHTDYRLADDDPPYASYNFCDGHTPGPEERQRPRDNPLSSLAIFGGGADLPVFTVVERNGRWFISPVRTLLESIVTSLRALEPGDVDAFAERLAASWHGGLGDGLSGRRIEPYPAEEAATDPVKATANAQALVDACGQLASGDRQQEVTEHCIQRLVDQVRIMSANRQEDGTYLAVPIAP